MHTIYSYQFLFLEINIYTCMQEDNLKLLSLYLNTTLILSGHLKIIGKAYVNKHQVYCKQTSNILISKYIRTYKRKKYWFNIFHNQQTTSSASYTQHKESNEAICTNCDVSSLHYESSQLMKLFPQMKY